MKIRKKIGNIKRYLQYILKNRGCDVCVYNDFLYKGVKGHWWYEYVHSNILSEPDGCSSHKIMFLGIYGQPWVTLKYTRIRPIVFHTLENIHEPNVWAKQAPNCYRDDPRVSLSLGYDYGDDAKYMRFPYWLQTFFGPDVTLDKIREKCEKINNLHAQATAVPKKYCSFIARYDYFGDRAILCDLMEQIAPLSYPSRFRQNDDELLLKYDDDKLEYLKQFRFNLCPENYDTYGYVTEKLFDAIGAGCIPIYWGSSNIAEPEILNQNAIVYIHPERDNSQVLSLIKKLNDDNDEYLRFYRQPVFLPDAPEKIWGYYERLNERLRMLLTK